MLVFDQGWAGQVGGANPPARLAQLCLGFHMWVGEDGQQLCGQAAARKGWLCSPAAPA